MLHMAEMAAVQDVHALQPPVMRAQVVACLRAQGLPAVGPLPVVIAPLPIWAGNKKPARGGKGRSPIIHVGAFVPSHPCIGQMSIYKSHFMYLRLRG